MNADDLAKTRTTVANLMATVKSLEVQLEAFSKASNWKECMEIREKIKNYRGIIDSTLAQL